VRRPWRDVGLYVDPAASVSASCKIHCDGMHTGPVTAKWSGSVDRPGEEKWSHPDPCSTGVLPFRHSIGGSCTEGVCMLWPSFYREVGVRFHNAAT